MVRLGSLTARLEQEVPDFTQSQRKGSRTSYETVSTWAEGKDSTLGRILWPYHSFLFMAAQYVQYLAQFQPV